MTHSETLPLTFGITIKQAFERSIDELRNSTDVISSQGTKITARKTILYLTLLAASVGSGGLYWTVSVEGGNRYSDVIGIAAGIGGVTTNIFFSAESFFDLSSAYFSVKSIERKILTGGQNERIEWSVSVFIGFFAALPIFFKTLSVGGLAEKILNYFSAFLNLPVNAVGSKSLIDWVKKIHFSVINLRNIKNDNLQEKKIILAKIKIMIARRLYEQALAFSNLSSLDQNQKLNELSTLSRNDFFSYLLLTELAPYQELNREEFGKAWMWSVTFGMLTFLGILQNLGYVLESYKAGSLIFSNTDNKKGGSIFLGSVFAILHMIPGFGFSFAGLLGLRERGNQFRFGIKSLVRKKLPRLYYVSSLIIASFALFSGFPADDLGRETWKEYCGWGGEVGARLVGLLHNLGVAIVYNLPQCLSFIERILETYLLKNNQVNKSVVFVNGLKELANMFEKMPLSVFEVFLNSSDLYLKITLVRYLSFEMRDQHLTFEEAKDLNLDNFLCEFYRHHSQHQEENTSFNTSSSNLSLVSR